jgi:hypothetical protein
MTLDIRTIVLLLALGNLIAVVLLCFFAGEHKRSRLVLVGKGLQSVAWFVYWLRMAPDPVFSFWPAYAISNLMLKSGWILEAVALLGIERRQAWVERVYQVLGCLLFAVVSANWSLHSPVPVVNASATGLSVLIFIIPGLHLAFGAGHSLFRRSVGSVYLAYCACATVRVGYILAHLDSASGSGSVFVNSLLFCALYALMLFGTLGYLLLLKERADADLKATVSGLEKALGEVKILRGLLPICAACKKIRDDDGYWEHMETYIKEHSEAQFSHGICPDCATRLYPDIFDNRELGRPHVCRVHRQEEGLAGTSVDSLVK